MFRSSISSDLLSPTDSLRRHVGRNIVSLLDFFPWKIGSRCLPRVSSTPPRRPTPLALDSRAPSPRTLVRPAKRRIHMRWTSRLVTGQSHWSPSRRRPSLLPCSTDLIPWPAEEADLLDGKIRANIPGGHDRQLPVTSPSLPRQYATTHRGILSASRSGRNSVSPSRPHRAARTLHR